MAVRGLRAPGATSLRRRRRAIPSHRPEALEQRTLLSMTLQYVPLDTKGGAGQPVTFQYDTAADGGQVIDAGVTVRSLFDTGFTAATSVNMFLRLDDIPGESTDIDHAGQIDLKAFSWTGDATVDPTTGQAAGAPHYSGLRFVSKVDKAAPLLMDRLLQGTDIPTADLSVRRAGVRDEFYHVDLDHAFVSSYRVTTAVDGTPSQEFTLGFTNARLTYRPQDAKGTLGTPVTVQWAINGETESGAPLPEPPVRQPSLLDEGFAAPATDMYLHLDNIPGESVAKGHEQQIEVESFSWGVEPGTRHLGEATPPRFSELRFVSRTNKASPVLMQRLATGQNIPNGDFYISKITALGLPVDFYHVDINDAFVSSYHVSTAVDGSFQEEFTLGFRAITVQCSPVDAKGTVGQPVTFQYDLAQSGGQILDAGVAVTSLLDTGVTAPSGISMFLRLDGIPGESTTKGHEQNIDLLSFSWLGDATRPVTPGLPTPPPQFSELRFVSKVNKASPLLMNNLARGANILTADFAARRTALTTSDFYTVHLENSTVGDYRVTTAADGTLEEEFTLDFSSALITYRPQDAKGGVGTPVSANWVTAAAGDPGGSGSILHGPAQRQPSLLDEGYAAQPSGNHAYLRLDGIKGEAVAKGHEEQIDVESFSWGADGTTVPIGGGGEIAGPPRFTELRFVSRTNKASPVLMQSIATGAHIPTGDFYLSKVSPLGVANDYYTVHLTDAIVSAYHTSTAHDGSLQEEYTLSFRSADVKYYPVDIRGTVGLPVEFRYDLATDGGRVVDAGAAPVSLLDTGFAPASGIDLFLRLDGIPGESVAKGHEQQVELESFSWLGDVAVGSAPGLPPGRPQFSGLRFVSKVNKASPLLMDRLARASVIPDADLAIQRSSTGLDFYDVDLDNAFITSYRVTTAADGTPAEEFTLGFTQAMLTYRPQDAKGTLGTPIVALWQTRAAGDTGGDLMAEPPVRQPSLLDEGYAPQPSGNHAYLRLDGIEGESLVKGHENQIDIDSFSWGVEPSFEPATGRFGPPRFSELRFVSRTNKASPLLMDYLATGRHIDSADFYITRITALGLPVDVYHLDFNNAFVSSYHVSTAHDGSLKEEFTLQFDAGAPPQPPALSVSGGAVTEGTGPGDTTATFNVSLSRPATDAVTVNWATDNGTALAGPDYAGASGTLVFQPGETAQTVSVPVVRDALDENDETFLVILSAPVGATILSGEASATIVDDEPPPTLSVADAGGLEGGPGMAFVLTLSAPSGLPVTVNFATAPGTAQQGLDYSVPTASSVTFAPGETSKSVLVTIVDDTLDEPAETLFLNLSNAQNATIADGQAVGTIVDNDDPPPVVTGVFVSSAGWAAPFLNTLAQPGLGDAQLGFAVPGGDAQLRVLPWAIDRFTVRFDRPVQVGAQNLRLLGMVIPQYDPADFKYDSNLMTATWSLRQPVRADKLVLQLDGVTGAGPGGTPLDGEWKNPGAAAAGGDDFPSGDGTSGGGFAFRMNVLSGDGNGDAATNAADLLALRARLRTPRGYSPFSDFSGDGVLSVADQLSLLRNFNRRLPDGEPPAPAVVAGAAVAAPVLAGPAPVTRDLFSRRSVLS